MGSLDVEQLMAGLLEETGALAETVRDADPDLPVPTCPGWSLRDLVEHVGNAHRWGATLVERRSAEPPPPETQRPQGPDWLREGAGLLVDAVRRTGAGTVVWTFLGPRPAAFWVRRMLHDTLVHRADATAAVGRKVGYRPELAADTISEGLELLSAPTSAQARPTLAELRGRGERLLLRPAEPAVRPGWMITRAPEGVRWERGDGPADVTLGGTVTELLLVFSRRLPPEKADVEITGDTALLDHWLARTAF
ncbi:TIGR03083 family protein [Thermomonospora echinospora]|uniref:TIGR03083 family protein n=1 Tax=Thermomonospora echinospora TaxID=1992 RepID=A0A1H5VI41_9ACTN|nr:maleylpyruvate isomerase family mycothiol-dependent enzyme [Thermomonospora echinospora]SEF86999.1 TIGR03083 family protein [Thermomonospora echinospora]